jgi:hypothetical protein
MKLIPIVTFLFTFCGVIDAQVPDTIWTKILHITNDLDDAKCVIQTDDNGFILTGSCVPDCTTSAIDLFILKTDPSGNINWVKTYHNDFIEEGYSVEQTNDSGFIIGGRALIITGPIPTANNQSDIWILKANSDGDTLWTKTYGGAGHDYCTSIKQTSDYGYIIAGTVNSKYAYPPNCYLDCNDYYNSRALLIKINNTGDIIWERTFDLGSYGNYAEQTNDGGFILTGFMVSANQMDILLVKTNSDGDLLWTKILGEKEFIEYGRVVRQIKDGYIIVGHKGPVPVGDIDVLIMKTDLSGNITWIKTYGNDLSDSGNSIEITKNGGYFITGITNAQYYIHQGDILIFEIDSTGNKLWEKTYDIWMNDYSWSSAKTFDGGYVITGMVGQATIGYAEVWLAKIGMEPSNVKGNQTVVKKYYLEQNYPNPFNPSTRIRYSIPKSSNVVIKVFDILGNEVETLVSEEKQIGIYELTLYAEGLPSGVYFYRLQSGDFVETKKMLLLK